MPLAKERNKVMSRHFTISVTFSKQISESYNTLGLYGYEAYSLLNGKGMFLEQNAVIGQGP